MKTDLATLAGQFDAFLVDQFGVLMDGSGAYEGTPAALSALALAQPSLKPRAATRLPAQSSAALLACSATMQASAAANTTRHNQTNRVGVRRSVPRPFLMQDPQPIGWARGDLT